MNAIEPMRAPALANALTPDHPPPFWKHFSAQSWMDTVPRTAYEQPFYEHRGALGPTLLLVNDADALRRMLLENVGNYPKAELQRRFTAMALGGGLVLSEGETWRTHRRIIAPTFEARGLGTYAPGIVAQAAAVARRWRGLPEGSVIDVFVAMSALTLAIISEAMFSAGDEALGAVVATALEQALALRPGLLDFLPLIGPVRTQALERRMRSVFAPLDAAVGALIEARAEAMDSAPDDLLSRLIRARDADTGSAMSAAEVRDQVVTIFFAGHETTAVALAWIWYLLSQRPEAERRLHAELATVLGGRLPTTDDLPNLAFTRALIEEAMRLYPPLSSLFARQAVRDDVIGGRQIRAGQVLIVSPWILHRHRGYWDDPDGFDPDRFLDARAQDRPRYAYMPFGAGPRICIGAGFAMMEAVLVLATLGQHVRLELAPGPPVALRHRATLRPAAPLRATVKLR
jgi:cytochrome P450